MFQTMTTNQTLHTKREAARLLRLSLRSIDNLLKARALEGRQHLLGSRGAHVHRYDGADGTNLADRASVAARQIANFRTIFNPRSIFLE